MKTKFVATLGLLFILTSCGSLILTPTNCRGNGVWGNLPEQKKKEIEYNFKEEYYVWNTDYEVKLKDFLKKRDVDCNDILGMSVSLKSVFFVKRELTVSIQKK